MRKIVVTGLGTVSPLAVGVSETWDLLVSGNSGINRIESFDTDDLPVKIAGQIPGPDNELGLDPNKIVDVKDNKKIDKFILYALAAAKEAVEDSGWEAKNDHQKNRTGVLIGSGIGGLQSIANANETLNTKGPRRMSPFFIPSCLINLASGQVSIKYGFKGPNHSVVTACSTGAHAIGDAARIIRSDEADIMIAGGSEAAVCRLGIAGFSAARALSTNFNDTPEFASRPWDQDRDGFVMGEGAGIVVLEELEHAKNRGAKIYAEIVGYGMSGDAHHITAPAEDGDGGFRSMSAAINNGSIDISSIDYINAHGTSTPLGDEIELKAVKRLFGDYSKKISMSSTKSSIGHLLGAAGAVEAIFSILAIENGIVPPTLNLNNACQGSEEIDLVPKVSKKRDVRAALSNSFGFGGTNATLVFARAD